MSGTLSIGLVSVACGFDLDPVFLASSGALAIISVVLLRDCGKLDPTQGFGGSTAILLANESQFL